MKSSRVKSLKGDPNPYFELLLYFRGQKFKLVTSAKTSYSTTAFARDAFLFSGMVQPSTGIKGIGYGSGAWWYG